MKLRSSGILLHITSLPSPYGIGDFGPAAYRFADLLHGSGQTYWQILPLNPTDIKYDSSPYHSTSAFAMNPLLISPEQLVADGLLESDEIASPPRFSGNHTDHAAVGGYKQPLLARAWERFRARGDRHDFERFLAEEREWLDDFTLFVALKQAHGDVAWCDWPAEVRDRRPEALDAARKELAKAIEYAAFLQYIAFGQWRELKQFCNDRGVHIIGDIPIYVDYDSADLWANREIYKLDSALRPSVVAGVPPDYFSATGQLWGNPIYNWDEIRRREFEWWIQRVRHNLGLFDIVRIDHFRGLVAYWEVPAGETTAINGHWVEAPSHDLLKALTAIDPNLPIIAEDLGLITPDVREMMERFELPGMKVLMFAFGDDMATNPYIPHNVPRHSLIYTGTHDNNTARGWFETEADDSTRARLAAYVGRDVTADTVAGELIRLAMMSPANTAIVPLQDMLGLDASARMNTPSTSTGNWRWRCAPDLMDQVDGGRLRELTRMYGRI